MQREGKAEVRDDSGWFPGKTVDFFFLPEIENAEMGKQ